MPPQRKTPTPRERARVEFTKDIKQVARRQLAEVGAAALSLRAVARELGLSTPSALYRYFPGRDALLTALIVDSYAAVSDAAEDAARELADRPALDRWVGICHAVRDWALRHPHEYALLFGSPVPGYAAPQDTVPPGTRVPFLLGALFMPAGQAPDGSPGTPAGPPPGSAADGAAVPAATRRALAPLLERLPPGVPADRVVSGLIAWTYLFGAVSFEVFGHRSAIVAEPRVFFDHEIRRLGALLGLAGAP
ncbi:TetR/AcrR family transcriptional regulator [Kitasatospora sp. NPDC059571]|uniref:TetR/AcrR family transcriptional regulator n=1 Tax=Kitasatospora sp. NPDC059571 TaxID=3346871 RepID=UPI00368359A8